MKKVQMVKPFHIVFVHGYTSSPKKEKYQIIAKELSILGVSFSMPELPGGAQPHSRDWLEIIDREVKISKEPVILIGHSLGTRAVLLYLDKYSQKVDTVILFAPFNNNSSENKKNSNFADFFEYDLDIEKIKSRANKFIVVHSKDDSAIEYRQGVEISKELGGELITFENMGHFSGQESSEKNAEEWLKIIKTNL